MEETCDDADPLRGLLPPGSAQVIWEAPLEVTGFSAALAALFVATRHPRLSAREAPALVEYPGTDPGTDFSFRYENRCYQIADHDAEAQMPRTRVTIERRLDDTLRFRWRERYLLPVPPLAPPAEPSAPAKPRSPAKKRPLTGATAAPPPPDHAQRQFPIRVGKARSTSPAPRATLPSPQHNGEVTAGHGSWPHPACAGRAGTGPRGEAP